MWLEGGEFTPVITNNLCFEGKAFRTFAISLLEEISKVWLRSHLMLRKTECKSWSNRWSLRLWLVHRKWQGKRALTRWIDFLTGYDHVLPPLCIGSFCGNVTRTEAHTYINVKKIKFFYSDSSTLWLSQNIGFVFFHNSHQLLTWKYNLDIFFCN